MLISFESFLIVWQSPFLMTIGHLQFTMSPTARLLPQMARCVRYNLKVINTAPSLPSFRALHINCPESISRENDLAVISTEDCLWTSRTLSLTLCSVVSQIGDGSLESSCHHLDCPCHLLPVWGWLLVSVWPVQTPNIRGVGHQTHDTKIHGHNSIQHGAYSTLT